MPNHYDEEQNVGTLTTDALQAEVEALRIQVSALQQAARVSADLLDSKEIEIARLKDDLLAMLNRRNKDVADLEMLVEGWHQQYRIAAGLES